MNTRERKRKAKVLQRRVRDDLLTLNPPGEYESQIMGQAGTDIPDPHSSLPVDYIECRNHKDFPSLNSIKSEMFGKAKNSWFAILKANYEEPLVIMPYEQWVRLMSYYFNSRRN